MAGEVTEPASPAAAGFTMPPEWAPHERTWMEFPPPNATFGTGHDGVLQACRATWASVARTIAAWEPVTVVCAPADADEARALLGPGIPLLTMPVDDAWLRDSGPTFLLDAHGRLGAACWRFNAWGNAGFSSFEHEQHVGAAVAASAGARVFRSSLVNEGGGIHVDGEGTVLVTTTVQLDPDRNPGWDAAGVEPELQAFLGVERVVWLPRGLTRDSGWFGTRGHVDIVAAFVRPGVVVVHVQEDPQHPDHEVSREVVGILGATTDARGRRLEVVPLPAPLTGWDDDGEPVDWSYVNHVLVNGAVVVGTFDDPNDERALEVLARCHRGRRIVPHDARTVFSRGGGLHCITQQQPRASA